MCRRDRVSISFSFVLGQARCRVSVKGYVMSGCNAFLSRKCHGTLSSTACQNRDNLDVNQCCATAPVPGYPPASQQTLSCTYPQCVTDKPLGGSIHA